MGKRARPELKRLEEMFYSSQRTVPSDSLMTYISQALHVFSERKLIEPYIISFPGKGTVESLSVTLARKINICLSGISIEQTTTNLNKLLENLSGGIVACYHSQTKPADREQLDGISLHFPFVRHYTPKGWLTRIEIDPQPGLANILEQFYQFPDDYKNLLLEAGSIEVKNDFYRENNPCDTLVHVRCTIRNNNPDYHFLYDCRTANLEVLPQSLIPVLESIFSLVCKRFSGLAVHRYTITPMRKIQ